MNDVPALLPTFSGQTSLDIVKGQSIMVMGWWLALPTGVRVACEGSKIGAAEFP